LIVLCTGALAAVAATGGVLRSTLSTSADNPLDPRDVHDPYRAGDPIPIGYLQVVGRDHIRPVYDPRFVGADDIGWPDDADVIGVEIDGDARAYPVGFLSGREIVNDEIAGDPVLVSW